MNTSEHSSDEDKAINNNNNRKGGQASVRAGKTNSTFMDISGISQAGLKTNNNATFTASDSLSVNMLSLKQAVEKLDDNRFAQLLNNDIIDSGEVLMLLYCAVVCFNQEKAFDILLKRDNYFKQKPEWYRIFSVPKVYDCLKNQPISPERR